MYTKSDIPNRNQCGFTLFEMLIVIAILSVTYTIAMPSYQDHIDNTNNGLAIADLLLIDQAFETYYTSFNAYPPTLSEVNMDRLEDPWGNAYQYVLFDADTNKGEKRKDKFLNPVNTDFDLYSMGKNGATAKPFTSAQGRDDIVRANNGQFVGLAENY